MRVHILGIDELDARERYVWQLYCQVCSLRPGVIPFPNLRKLRLYQDYEQADRDRSILLFPSSLRELRVDFGSSAFNHSLRIAEGYLLAAARQVPMLERLSLHGEPPPTSYMCIAEYKNLHTLDLRHSHTVDPQVYQHLISAVSTMTKLVEFHLPDQGLSGIQEDCIPSCKGFHRLRILGIQASPDNIIQFLNTIDAPRLRTVTCNGGNIQSTPSGWRECVRKLCLIHGASLRSVDLRSRALNVWAGGTGDWCHMFKDIIVPLLALHRLEEIALEFFMVDLSTKDLYDMVSAWPNLRHLKIKFKIGHLRCDHSAYNSLISLARLCAELSHLELVFQDDKLPDIAEWPLLPHGLRELKLGVPYCIRDKLGPFLNRIFPERNDP